VTEMSETIAVLASKLAPGGQARLFRSGPVRRGEQS
jgi:hypothetical protein